MSDVPTPELIWRCDFANFRLAVLVSTLCIDATWTVDIFLSHVLPKGYMGNVSLVVLQRFDTEFSATGIGIFF